MKENFKDLLSDSTIKISLFVSFGLIIFQSLVIFIFYPKFPPLIPIFNSQPWGENRLFYSRGIFLLPVVLLFFLFLNTYISASTYKKNTLLARILSVNSLIFIVLGFLAYLQIILLVF